MPNTAVPRKVSDLIGESPELRRALSQGQIENISTFRDTDGSSYQPVAVDLTLAATAGALTGDTATLAPVMGNVFGSSLDSLRVGNTIAGLIGELSVTGTIPTTYPIAAVLGIINGDDFIVNSTVPNAFTAVLGGDSGTAIANAAYGVDTLNSTAASGFHYGVDLYNAAHDGYQAVDESFYITADMRLAGQNIVKTGSGTPEAAVTAVVGSLYLDIAGGASTTLYVKESGSGNTGWVAK